LPEADVNVRIPRSALKAVLDVLEERLHQPAAFSKDPAGVQTGYTFLHRAFHGRDESPPANDHAEQRSGG
jgi:hypothetical protein